MILGSFPLQLDFHIQNYFSNLLRSKTNKTKLLKSCFYSTWKFWKFPKSEHFIELWSWGSITKFQNTKWHKKNSRCYIVLQFSDFLSILSIWFEFSSLSIQKFLVIWIFHRKIWILNYVYYGHVILFLKNKIKLLTHK